MANTNSKLYTNKDMARICDVSEASMTNLVKSLELVPVKTGKYGRKFYNPKDLEKVKIHWYLNMTVYHGIEKDDNSEEAGMLKLVK